MSQKISEQSKAEALKIAKGIKKPNQSKEQTKLISQGIEKGIALYKQQQKAKARETDKQRKALLKEKHIADAATHHTDKQSNNGANGDKNLLGYLPWALLVISWLGFLGLKLTEY